jgi:hypothetical protein
MRNEGRINPRYVNLARKLVDCRVKKNVLVNIDTVNGYSKNAPCCCLRWLFHRTSIE